MEMKQVKCEDCGSKNALEIEGKMPVSGRKPVPIFAVAAMMFIAAGNIFVALQRTDASLYQNIQACIVWGLIAFIGILWAVTIGKPREGHVRICPDCKARTNLGVPPANVKDWDWEAIESEAYKK